MKKRIIILALSVCLIGGRVTGRYVEGAGDSWWSQLSNAQEILGSDEAQTLEHVTAQWRTHMNNTHSALFRVMATHIDPDAYTESAWWWLSVSEVYFHCRQEENLLFALARTSIMGSGADMVVQRLDQDRERGFYLIDQLNAILIHFEPGGWLTSQAKQATALRVLREDCKQLCEKFAFLKHYIQYRRDYFVLYLVEDQCWKQYARELQVYQACNGDHARLKQALQDIYAYELRFQHQWNATAYIRSMRSAINALYTTIGSTPYYYENRVAAARELAQVLTYLQHVVIELGW